MTRDYQPAGTKIHPKIMQEGRRPAIDTTGITLDLAKKRNYIAVVSDTPCFIKVDNNSDDYDFSGRSTSADFVDETQASVDDDNQSFVYSHPGSGASFPVVGEEEFRYLHIAAASGTVKVEVYAGSHSEE